MEVSVGIYTIIFVFFFLIIPGFITRRFYFNGEFSKQINIGISSFMNLIYSFFVGVFLSLVFVFILNLFNDRTIDIETLLNRFDSNFVSPSPNLDPTQRFKGLSSSIYTVYLPFLAGMYIFSAMYGFFLSKIVLIFGLDTKWKFFRYGNNWHYLFSGKILKFKNHSSASSFDNKLGVKYTYLDVLVTEMGDKTTLYSGLLADYDICPNDISKLEKIHLLKATRYKKTEESVIVKNIPGNLFTIMGDRILNINCTYICFEDQENKERVFILKKRILVPTQILTTLFFLTIMICTMLSLKIVDNEYFIKLLNQTFYIKLCVLFLLNIVIGLVTPFEIDSENKKIKFIGWRDYLSKIVLIVLFVAIFIYFVPYLFNFITGSVLK